MIYQEENFTGKNGMTYLLRSPVPADAQAMIAYMKQTAEETEHGLSYPEELDFTIEDEENFIAGAAEEPGRVMISAFADGVLVGSASLGCVLGKKKTRHRAEFGIAILKREWGRGLGRKLVTELIACAKKAGYEQLELETVATNHAAIGLYQTLGFQTYGRRPNSFKLKSGGCSDELLMVLDLGDQAAAP